MSASSAEALLPAALPAGDHLADVWFRVTDLEVVSASGCTVQTADGERYTDFSSGIGVVSTGHCHPHVVEAVQRQAASFVHAQANCYRHPSLAALADRLATITPEGIDRFFVTNSGAEAVEAAVKLARQATDRSTLVVFEGAFHGRTALTMAMTTAKAVYRARNGPFPPGIHVAPFPQARGGPAEVERCLDALRKLFRTQTAPAEVAAVVLEPVLGEGGYLPAPTAFVQGVAELCRELGVLFVMDEVQTGFGRTGGWFAADRHGVRPDLLVMGKGIASGFPLAAVGASDELTRRWTVGSHGGTYGGNPIGCAAASATIDVLSAPGFLDAVEHKGERLRSRLIELQLRHPGLWDVRGLGLMVGCELRTAAGTPDPARAGAVLRHCLEEGRLILMTCGPDANVVRWIPPLVVEEAELDAAVDVFAAALRATEP